MQRNDLIRLISLAAIWGASFLFIRIVAPVLGPLWTAEGRVAIAAFALLVFMRLRGQSLDLRRYWGQYLILGLLNSALPFVLYAVAALSIPSGYSAILNATSPIWGALIGAALLGEALTSRKWLGMVLGIIGVAFLVRLGPVQFNHDVLIAALCCLGAAICYGFAGAYTKLKANTLAPMQMAAGSQLGAALLILPLLPLAPIRAEVTPFIMLIVVALALLCSALAYLLYFRLMSNVGPSKALTVTFLIPLFALLWGFLFLHEHIALTTLIGCAGVVAATWLVAGPQGKPRVSDPTSSVAAK